MKGEKQDFQPTVASERRKRLILLLFVFLILLLLIGWQKARSARYVPPPIKFEKEVSPRADSRLWFEPENIEVKINSIFPLMIKVDTGQNTAAAVKIALKFDPEVLEVIDLIPSDFFQPPLILEKKTNNVAGTIFVTLACPPEQPKQGSGNLFLVNYKVKEISSKKTTTVEFLPQTEIAAIKEQGSVLKFPEKATIAVVE
ncbi:MAG TPA: cohesin domain-containing protein [Candidatus Bathyarchaeia archaeon]|nr:cohesin domain-containing protein [Candidatus Bathyarchaeia archaeon]